MKDTDAEKAAETTDLISASLKAKISEEVQALLDGAKIEKINTGDQAQNALSLVKQLGEKKKEIETEQDGLVGPHRDKCDIIYGFFRPKRQSIEGAVKNLNIELAKFDEEQEQKRIEDQRKIDEEIRKKNEKDAADAKEKRDKEEALRKDAEAKRLAADNAATAEERIRLEKEAAKLDSKADTAASQAIAKEDAATTRTGAVATKGVELKGFSAKKHYDGEISDMKAFVLECVKLEKWHLLLHNEDALNKMVDAEGTNFKFPGVRVVPSFKTRVSRKAA